MKKIIFLLTLLMPLLLFSQAKIVFNGANIIISNNAKLVVQNPAPDALTVLTTGGIISQGSGNNLLWNIGTNAAQYTIPFISNGNNIPLSFTTSGAAGNGIFILGTYAGATWKNSDYLPPTVTNVNRNGADNSNHVIDRFWQIRTSGYTVKPTLSDLTFSYNDNEWNQTGNNIIEANLTAQSWNNSSDIWVTPGVSTDNPSTNNVTVLNVAASDLNNWWTLVDANYVLPLTLLSFSVEKQNENAHLKWTVARQINVSYYEVQRSINAIDFMPVGKVYATNNTNLNDDYSYTNALNNINANTIYYRLRMVDQDGKFAYSPVKIISLVSNELIKLSPNPATNVLVMTFGTVAPGTYVFTVFDASGKQMLMKNLEVAPNSAFYFHRTADMAAGTYFISITGQHVKQVFPVIFQ